MKILLIGSGGREHAMAWKLTQSTLCDKLFILPGNPGTAEIGTNIALPPDDFEAIHNFTKQESIDLMVVGPEQPLADGIADYFTARGLPVAGPHQEAARLESSKDFAKQFMMRHGIPTAAYRSFKKGEETAARQYILTHSVPVVVKASGLAAGKGVVICDDREEAANVAVEMLSGAAFGESGETVVIEQFLTGIEVSVFVITDGKEYVLLPEAKDYKRIGEGDIGLNTGGMGAVSPVPFADEIFMKKVKERIIIPTVRGFEKDQLKYSGFIFFGLMAVEGEPWVIEYNVRMGDPETEVVMPRLESDLAQLLWDAANGQLKGGDAAVKKETCATVMLVSGGYPGKYETGKEISGLEQVKGSLVFHAGTSRGEYRLTTAGGRVMAVTSLSNSMESAVYQSLENASKIQFEGKYYRRDIGNDLKNRQ